MPAKSTRKSTPDPEPFQSPDSEPLNYEATVGEVEAIITQLETGELPLDEIFFQFEKAVGALRQCETYLKGKREQVDLLIETLEDG